MTGSLCNAQITKVDLSKDLRDGLTNLLGSRSEQSSTSTSIERTSAQIFDPNQSKSKPESSRRQNFDLQRIREQRHRHRREEAIKISYRSPPRKRILISALDLPKINVGKWKINDKKVGRSAGDEGRTTSDGQEEEEEEEEEDDHDDDERVVNNEE
ncbi:hypothetical protein RUM43_008671 [Polyplax serrata]|uniref:Uncharacterized protein n=1 Tax=Polyplax serrata TaxID=468196 RepID=A0AAN8P9N4_POLSC